MRGDIVAEVEIASSGEYQDGWTGRGRGFNEVYEGAWRRAGSIAAGDRRATITPTKGLLQCLVIEASRDASAPTHIPPVHGQCSFGWEGGSPADICELSNHAFGVWSSTDTASVSVVGMMVSTSQYHQPGDTTSGSADVASWIFFEGEPSTQAGVHEWRK